MFKKLKHRLYRNAVANKLYKDHFLEMVSANTLAHDIFADILNGMCDNGATTQEAFDTIVASGMAGSHTVSDTGIVRIDLPC